MCDPVVETKKIASLQPEEAKEVLEKLIYGYHYTRNQNRELRRQLAEKKSCCCCQKNEDEVKRLRRMLERAEKQLNPNHVKGEFWLHVLHDIQAELERKP